MTNPAAADGIGGVPELRGDASVPGPGTGCPCRQRSAPGASGGSRSGSARRTDRVEPAGYHLIGLLANKSPVDVSISSLYESVENLSETHIRWGLDKISLLDLVTPSLSSCSSRSQPPPLLLYSDTDTKTEATTKWYYYTCGNHGNHYYESDRQEYVSDVKGTVCPSCGRAMESRAEYVAPTTSSSASGGDGKGERSREERGFVRGVVTYMVMDDLEVTPMSTISSIALLTKFNVRDVGALEEKVVKVGVEEVLLLLKASLQSKTALTEVFLK
ncbi:DUF674 domain-containing protein [Cinnamomum micranthum f. kanehirae]|uniref:DUF674 domain-containing protein n=1 Tax=Cinnamomum micranthum f. kanehirae TaxID=337451 RepID=A0A443PXJ6_9MAGN|nr:DUF674 domain-containing protein [Cinnamomum micranthum f. kanehirae]